MKDRRRLSARYWADRAAARLWRLAPELPSPRTGPALPPLPGGFEIRWPAAYGWPLAGIWVDGIRSALGRLAPLQPEPMPQLDNRSVRLAVVCDGRRSDVVLDYSDSTDVDAPGYLECCLLYFKMQYRRAGYDDPRIVPGQYVPSEGGGLYHYLPRLRRLRDDAAAERYEVYGRFGLGRAGDVRSRALTLLQQQRRFAFRGGAALRGLTGSLSEAAHARVCIDLPGRGPFCHRLVDYLAIGACIVAYPHEALFDPPLLPGTHIAYCRPDLGDLVELCEHYLRHAEERQAMVRASREYFDAVLHKDSLARYYLGRVLRALDR